MSWLHIKTNRLYKQLYTAIDCTKGRDEPEVVIYTPLEVYEQGVLTELYTRDKIEFFQKFKPV